MMKSKIALAVLLTSVALAPASARPKTHHKAASTAKAKSKPKAKAAAQPVQKAAAHVAAATPQNRNDRYMDSLSMQFVTALWRIDPEDGIYVGKFDAAAKLTIPDAATRAKKLAFIDEWLDKFGKLNADKLSPNQRTDLAVLLNKLKYERWQLTTFREFEWNPAEYNVAQTFDLILTTEYAAKAQRLRTILKRLADVPAYYQAAQASIVNPTHEHTQLAIQQAPGTLVVLADLGKAAQESILTPQEKAIFAQRIANAGTAVVAWVDFLTDLDKSQAQMQRARSFRIGKDLYEQKFAFEIQSASTGEQTYRKALAARDELLTRMDGLADQLWDKTMGAAAKPADRYQKIGMVIDKLSLQHTTAADFLPEIRRQIPQLQEYVIKNNLVTIDPSKPLVVRETPLYQRGVAGASIDAPGPYRPKDKTYYNVTPLDGLTPEQAESSLREYNNWMLQILNIHEAIPGHYTQLMNANRSPSLVKALFGNGAMVEGWAVYGERMMLESGYGDNAPELWLMWCKWNLRSVSNTILDYSVHVLGMTREQAIDLLVRQAFQTPQEAAEKWKRAQLSSVQLSSYFSGYSDIMELRERRKEQLGERFNLKQFHDQFLGYGNAPVKIIGQLMQ
ncbi:hypothetical protein ASD28_25385 [Massilia sp. Root133]|uniref:DUF885 family protein n=1 Tax=Massilia cellulosiltytica TaxID=2683234 RepID=A0A7X3FWC8_9BURK|nr:MULTISPECIES: DUF885 domain-containing protein [Telluria group]KQY14846.1 hypothetical protein ASD28_25385 [Massilia sp. Root133]KQZ43665.1 hypothetical protein ASD92_02260 [Massilia sp. Root1485]MVW59198.1 DUF885 family protein [Telluria cellulosilytica]